MPLAKRTVPQTRVVYLPLPTTERRQAIAHFTSQHTVTVGNTSQALPAMDENMRRRLLIDYVSELGVPQQQE